MIDAELRFEPLLRAGQRRIHDRGIVDERIDPLLLRGDLGCGANAVQVTEVERQPDEIGIRRDLLDPLNGIQRPGPVAAAKEDARAPGGKHSRDFETDPGIGACDDEGFSRLLGDVGFGETLAIRHFRSLYMSDYILIYGVKLRRQTPSRAGRSRPAGWRHFPRAWP